MLGEAELGFRCFGLDHGTHRDRDAGIGPRSGGRQGVDLEADVAFEGKVVDLKNEVAGSRPSYFQSKILIINF